MLLQRVDKRKKSILYICVLVCTVIIIVNIISIYQVNAGVHCRDVTVIARDVDRVNYLKNWITESLSNPKFLEIERKNRLSRHADPTREEFAQINFDLDYLGMDLSGAGIDLHRDLNADYLDPTNIKSVSFSQGRDSIVIRVNGSKALGVCIGEGRKRIDITDDVTVLC